MTAEDYIKQELEAGRLTYHHLAALAECFQDNHSPLMVDGKAGPATRAAIESAYPKYFGHHIGDDPGKFLHCPLPVLLSADLKRERHATITSGFNSVNPSRPNHDGCDWFYRWEPGDKPDFVGNGGAATKQANGQPKWVVPYNVEAIAAAAGVVQLAGNSATGYRCWIDHGNGWRSGYFHLMKLLVHAGDKVRLGDPVGLVGDNPKDGDARHLHFELSPVSHYAPVNPEPYLLT